MATVGAPKRWCLEKVETINSYENWQENQVYVLSRDINFSPFLLPDQLGNEVKWAKKTSTNPNRGFTDDAHAADDPPVGLTAAKKVLHLETMLNQIANYCTVISRATIVKSSTSMRSVWQAIRLHYCFQKTGSRFLDFDDFKLESDERPEDLYQRMLAFVDDNLLRSEGGIKHHGESPTSDEDLTPMVENLLILSWLRLVHPGLPHVVKQRFATQLRSNTLASIKDEISLTMEQLLDAAQDSDSAKIQRSAASCDSYVSEEARVLRSGANFQNKGRPGNRNSSQGRPRIPDRSCPLCTEAKRPSNHYLSTCKYLPDKDRRYMSKIRQLTDFAQMYLHDECEDEYQFEDNTSDYEELPKPASTRRVNIKQSPFFKAFYHEHPLQVTLDTGAETNLIKSHVARYMGITVTKTSQMAMQADGTTPLTVIGECHIQLSRNGHKLTLDALVVDEVQEDILAGMPFLTANDIAIHPAKFQITIAGEEIVTYATSTRTSKHNAIRRAHTDLVRAPAVNTVLWPGDYIELDIPGTYDKDAALAVEPRAITPVNKSAKSTTVWPSPGIVEAVGGKIRLTNTTTEPRQLTRNEHFCQIRPVTSPPIKPQNHRHDTSLPETPQVSARPPYNKAVSVDPDNQLTPTQKSGFNSVLAEFDDVFSPEIPGYNDAAGPFKAVINMGPVQPPQRKGRVPQYDRTRLGELQDKFDELESLGVFQKPESLGITVEYLNPSFLVLKSSGGQRLVTAFADVGRYCKPQPSLMPDVDSILRNVARWKYIIITDLSSAFYQIPLARDSMKYCGVVTPYKGVRVYTRCAMGMPGSETALEEMMCRVLGDQLKAGTVTKLADDLYCGGDTPEELLSNWRQLLSALHSCNLHLSAKKTVVCPKTTTMLGWIWSQGKIQASPHRIATLASCKPPDTVKGMRSFIGAYKVLARVINDCASYIDPLDTAISGKQSRDKLDWDANLSSSFARAQAALMQNKCIVLPQPSDQLWIVTDGSVKCHGIGATLYVTRGGKPQLAGFFSAKLKKHQVSWLPCEVEALGIATAIKHYSPFIIQSKHQACVLTDSKPCVQAIDKLCRGEFSSSPRITSFLSIVSRYQVHVRHLAGTANVPSDFASRNAPDCYVPSCQICSFISRSEESVVMRISVHDILRGTASVPFANRKAWISTQLECHDLRRTHAYLKSGIRPSNKMTDITDTKRYLNVATIARDGLLVVKRAEPLCPTRECIIVPRTVLTGLLTALHLKLDHPTKHQLKCVMQRQYFALNMDEAIEMVTDNCHQCASLLSVPEGLVTQSTSDPPPAPGLKFAADVMRRNKQFVLILRESVTSYTASCIVDNERHQTLAEALVHLCSDLRPLDGPFAVVRVDPAPGFVALRDSPLLADHRISLEIGQAKNRNKNPIAERAVQELGMELLKQGPRGGPVSPLALMTATTRLNARIRGRGLSAREMWYQRDQYTNEQLPIADLDLIKDQQDQRTANHIHSANSKARFYRHPSKPDHCLSVGDLVYVKSDHNKSCARDRYIIMSIDKEWCVIKKFTGVQLRSASYKVRLTDCYAVPSNMLNIKLPHCDDSEDEQSESAVVQTPLKPSNLHVVPPTRHDILPPDPPDIPHELTQPPIAAEEHIDVPYDQEGVKEAMEAQVETESVSSVVHDILEDPGAPDPQGDQFAQVLDTGHGDQLTQVVDTGQIDQLTKTVNTGRPKRARQPPKHLEDYEVY